MARKRESTFPRIIDKIDHPKAHQIPLLALDPIEEWPAEFKTPWMWTGAVTGTEVPVISHQGKLTSVARLLYGLFVTPVYDHQQVRAKLDPRDVNPLNRYVIDVVRDLPPPATNVADFKPAFADEFDVEVVADQLDERNPKSITEIRDLLDEYYPRQIFEALEKANLLTRLGIKSPMEITR